MLKISSVGPLSFSIIHLLFVFSITFSFANEFENIESLQLTECNDGIDNDGDGYADYAFDMGCYGPSDPSETATNKGAENGWTTFDISTDTSIYYISSDGNDNNSGLSPKTPLATFGKAKSLLSKNRHAWVLFKRGDSFNFEINLSGVHGRSKDHPILISSYGYDANRPVINNKISAIKPSSNIYIIGLHIQGNNPENYNGQTNGIRFVGSHSNIYLEDNRVEYGQVTFQRYGENATLTNISLHRNIISRAYSMNSHAQGLFVSGANNLSIKDNFFDHNGWLVQSQTKGQGQQNAQATIYNHNMYINASRNISIHRNLIFRASSMGIKMRSDTQGLSKDISITGNVFYEGEIGVGIGGNTKEKFRFVNAEIENNVFLSLGKTRPTNRNISWPIAAKDISGLKVSNNVIAHQEHHKGSYALKITNSIENALIQDNIVYGVDEVGFVLDNKNWRNVRFENNIIHDSKLSRARAIITSGSLEGLEFFKNKYFLRDKNNNWLTVLFLKFKGLASHKDYFFDYTGDGLESVEALDFKAPNRNLATYFEQFDHSTEDEKIMSSIIDNRSRFLWDEKYTADSLSKYIFEGFELISQEELSGPHVK